MRGEPPQRLDYGVQKFAPETVAVKQRLKRLFIGIAILWFAAMSALKLYYVITGDPSE